MLSEEELSDILFDSLDNDHPKQMAVVGSLIEEIYRLREGLEQIKNAGHRQVEDLMLIAFVTLGE
jgi:hypothetical protein